MGRIVVNKHYDNSLNITLDKFKNKGEVIVCNEPGFEGLYILSNDGSVIKVGQSGESTEVSQEFKDYLKNYYLTSAETITLVSGVSERVRQLEENGVGDGNVQANWDETDVDSDAFILNKPTIISSGDVKTMVAEEVAKVVASADTSYDTLKEIADWILNDTTGAAAMAQDIASLKGQLAAMQLGAKATCSVSPSVIYEGETKEITVGGGFSPSTLTPYSVEIREGSINGTLVASGNDATVTYKTTVDSTKSYYTIAKYNNTTFSASTRVSAYKAIYAGFGTSAEAVINNSANKLSARSSANGQYTATATTNGVSYYILVPSGMAVPTNFKMGGSPFTTEKTTEAINGISYTVIKSGSVFNNGGEVDITAS